MNEKAEALKKRTKMFALNVKPVYVTAGRVAKAKAFLSQTPAQTSAKSRAKSNNLSMCFMSAA